MLTLEKCLSYDILYGGNLHQQVCQIYEHWPQSFPNCKELGATSGLCLHWQFMLSCQHRWAVPRYFFSTGTVGTLEKMYRYRSAGTSISQFLGGTRYFCKIFCI